MGRVFQGVTEIMEAMCEVITADKKKAVALTGGLAEHHVARRIREPQLDRELHSETYDKKKSLLT